MVCACGLLSAGEVRADGAFPDAQTILTPAALPHEIVLATNFGPVTSVDDGQTWAWTCEQDQNSYATLYQLGAPPRNRLFAVSSLGLVFSDDGSCSWGVAGVAAGATVLDAFADPTNPDWVMAIVAEAGDAGSIFEVLESSDGGTTLGTVRYTADGGDHLTGVEIARSAPATVYVTISSGASFLPKLARTADGGSTWQVRDLSAALGAGTNSIRLIAIDPGNPDKVFLRVGGTAGERVAVTDDGGVTVTTPLVLPTGIVSAFARLPSGSLVVAGVAGVDPVAFRSIDGGATFQPLPTPPNLRALSARGGTLYGVADNYNDGFAVGTSLDEGMTWQPLMRYDEIQAIQTCARTVCEADCLARADSGSGRPPSARRRPSRCRPTETPSPTSMPRRPATPPTTRQTGRRLQGPATAATAPRRPVRAGAAGAAAARRGRRRRRPGRRARSRSASPSSSVAGAAAPGRWGAAGAFPSAGELVGMRDAAHPAVHVRATARGRRRRHPARRSLPAARQAFRQAGAMGHDLPGSGPGHDLRRHGRARRVRRGEEHRQDDPAGHRGPVARDSATGSRAGSTASPPIASTSTSRTPSTTCGAGTGVPSREAPGQRRLRPAPGLDMDLGGSR